jgi:hypothetical protein
MNAANTHSPADRRRAQLVQRVTKLHGHDVADHVAHHYPDALELLADGWTIAGALAHVDQLCDVTVCTHPTHQPCAACGRRDAGHGHFALYCQPCSELPYGSVAP